jgi:AraC family transcriptional regulator, chitin signaling transcriptional activator
VLSKVHPYYVRNVYYIDFQIIGGLFNFIRFQDMSNRFGFLIWILIGILTQSHGQNLSLESGYRAEIKGTPRIVHYSRQDFNGDPQIWTMTQDNDGIMYFGNNDGVLIFDGARWHKIPLPNNSSVRSLLHSNGKIYAGGFNEFGTIERDEYGNYHFHSFMDLLRTEDQNLENIWSINSVQGHLIFRSFSKLVALANNKAFTIPASDFYLSAAINDRLYLVDKEGVKTLNLQNLEFQSLITSSELKDEIVSAIINGTSEDELLIITKPGNAYNYRLSDDHLSFARNYFEENSNNQIISAIKSTNGNIYLGTLSSQIKVLDETGEPIPLSNDHMKLQDNTVLNLFESAEGNIWALLNNGIDCINISSPVSVLFENASVFDVLIRGGKIYAATNQGVYVSQHLVHNPYYSSLEFHKIPKLEGQAWKLQVINDHILVSHDRGTFIIEDEKAMQLEGMGGSWKVIPINGRPNSYYICTYLGLYLLEYSKEKGFETKGMVEEFNESSRDIMQDGENGVFWVCHGYKGIFRIKMDASYLRVVSIEHFQENGLPSPFNINVFRWDDAIVFTTNAGIYQFNKTTHQFELHPELNTRFGTDRNVRKLLQYEEKTWFVHDNEAGYFEKGKEPLNKGLFLELKGTFNRGMECISPINNENVLIGTTTGLYAYDLTFQNPVNSSHPLITFINYKLEDELIPVSLTNASMKLPYQASNIKFEFSAPKLKDQTQVQYSSFLEGIDEHWSDWSSTANKEFSKLYPGKYTFKVKARNMLGEYAPEATHSFEVLPVWYLTRIAFGLYILVLGLGLYSSRKLVKRKIVREKNKTRNEEQEKQKVLELQLQQLRLEREKEKIAKDKEQLEEDVIHKSKELANYTMLLVRKRELLTEMHDRIKEVRDLAKNEKLRNQLRQLTRQIGIHLNDEEHIRVFETNFERVHHEFFEQLKLHYPDLNQKELRLCALVKMNLSNKEIAPILNISIRGVETARYRLRKRLSLNQDDNMVEFLEKLSPNNAEQPEAEMTDTNAEEEDGEM